MEEVSKKKILVVDDDIDIINLIEKDLASAGYDVYACTTEGEALSVLSDIKFHCAILDIVLGANETSGPIIQFLSKQECDGINCKVPVILTSAHMSDEFGDRVRQLGVNIFDTVKKPFKKGRFSEAILNMPPRDVLILDDDFEMRALIEKQLYKEKFNFSSVGTVEEAIRLLTEKKFLCAIIDIIMSASSTSESVIQFIKSSDNVINAGIPLIVTSAHMNQEYARRIKMKSKMVSFAIPKPSEKGTYAKAVATIFGGVGRKESDYYIAGGGVPPEMKKYYVPFFEEEDHSAEKVVVKKEQTIEDKSEKRFKIENRLEEGKMQVKRIETAGLAEVKKRLLSEDMVNARDENGETALMVFSKYGELEEVKKLHEEGASILLKSKSGKTALHFCARTGNLPTLLYLLDNGANIRARDGEEIEPLGDAILGGNSDMAAELIKRGSRLTTRISGKSYLHVAEAQDDLKLFKTLIEAGCDLKVRDPQSGDTVLDICKKRGKTEYLAVIKAFKKIKPKS